MDGTENSRLLLPRNCGAITHSIGAIASMVRAVKNALSLGDAEIVVRIAAITDDWRVVFDTLRSGHTEFDLHQNASILANVHNTPELTVRAASQFVDPLDPAGRPDKPFAAGQVRRTRAVWQKQYFDLLDKYASCDHQPRRLDVLN